MAIGRSTRAIGIPNDKATTIDQAVEQSGLSFNAWALAALLAQAERETGTAKPKAIKLGGKGDPRESPPPAHPVSKNIPVAPVDLALEAASHTPPPEPAEPAPEPEPEPPKSDSPLSLLRRPR